MERMRAGLSEGWKPRARILTPLVAAALASGLACGTGVVGGGENDAEAGPPCGDACPLGWSCADGGCVPPGDPCATLVCRGGTHCEDGSCIADDPCAHVECPNPGEVCQNGECVAGAEDLDGDGFLARADCDDRDAQVHPGADEACNGVDDDCDASTADGSSACPGRCCGEEPACRDCCTAAGCGDGDWACEDYRCRCAGLECSGTCHEGGECCTAADCGLGGFTCSGNRCACTGVICSGTCHAEGVCCQASDCGAGDFTCSGNACACAGVVCSGTCHGDGECCGAGDCAGGQDCSAIHRCAPDCAEHTRGTSTYLFCAGALPWTGARAGCADHGGDLATISDSAENSWVADTAAPSSTLSWWIGLNDRATEGTFLWADGTPVTFTSWVLEEPNDFGGGEDCTAMREHTDTGWGDLPCEVERPYICER